LTAINRFHRLRASGRWASARARSTTPGS